MGKYKRFLIMLVAFLVLFFAFYFVSYIIILQKSSSNFHSFKNYLISNTGTKSRIIIDSGSNSFHSINSKMIEDHFGKITINLADNAEYPLRAKLYRINKFANKADIVILPLEYRFYLNDIAPKIFYDHIFFELSHYFIYSPLLYKIKLIFNTPISSLLKSFIRYINTDFNMLKSLNHTDYFEDFKNGLRGDHIFVSKLPFRNDITNSCKQFIFLKEVFGKDDLINNIFKENLELMKKIEKEKGVKFIFTYPAVVGDDCYDFNGKNGAEYKKFLTDIKKLCNSNGFEFIGDFQSSYFPRKQIHDTWYHILPEARDVRTKKLIENLDKSNLKNDLYANGLQNSSISN